MKSNFFSGNSNWTINYTRVRTHRQLNTGTRLDVSWSHNLLSTFTPTVHTRPVEITHCTLPLHSPHFIWTQHSLIFWTTNALIIWNISYSQLGPNLLAGMQQIGQNQNRISLSFFSLFSPCDQTTWTLLHF